MIDQYYDEYKREIKVEDILTNKEPSLVTGEGHGHYRGPNKQPRYKLKKKRTARKIANKSKKRNRA